MDSPPLRPISTNGSKPVTEADLHAYADQLLDPARHVEIDAFLHGQPVSDEAYAIIVRTYDNSRHKRELPLAP